ncbi:hypothetical protein Mapa_016100 [Marchantia paleacea]|nr:hypothetical protein Mapa_016100 [Marchantia paleacea]
MKLSKTSLPFSLSFPSLPLPSFLLLSLCTTPPLLSPPPFLPSSSPHARARDKALALPPRPSVRPPAPSSSSSSSPSRDSSRHSVPALLRSPPLSLLALPSCPLFARSLSLSLSLSRSTLRARSSRPGKEKALKGAALYSRRLTKSLHPILKGKHFTSAPNYNGPEKEKKATAI